MAYSNDILFKAEDAIAARLATASLPSGTTVRVLGDSAADFVTPYIGVIADSSTNKPVMSQNFQVDLRLEICTSPDDLSRTLTKAILAAAINALTTDTIAADLSSDVADFRCFGVNFTGQRRHIDDRHHVYILEMRIDCCGADV